MLNLVVHSLNYSNNYTQFTAYLYLLNDLIFNAITNRIKYSWKLLDNIKKIFIDVSLIINKFYK